jgi:hypothetical protein
LSKRIKEKALLLSVVDILINCLGSKNREIENLKFLLINLLCLYVENKLIYPNNFTYQAKKNFFVDIKPLIESSYIRLFEKSKNLRGFEYNIDIPDCYVVENFFLRLPKYSQLVIIEYLKLFKKFLL